MNVKLIKLNYQDKNITLIPTAHVSKESATFVEETINELKPDTICVELDQDRYNSINNPDRYRNTSIVQIIKDGKVGLMLVNLILANYQKRMAQQLGSKSGQEMIIGINKAKETGANLVLADRSVSVTFKRIWASLTFFDKIKLLSIIISSFFDDENLSEEDLKNLQQSDALNAALAEVNKSFPKVANILINERDKYLAYKIKNAPGNNIVAILGAAHTIGIQKYINEDYSISEFDVVPQKKLSSKVFSWLIPVIIVVAILLSFSFDTEMGLHQILSWILYNGTLAALGTLVAGGHILSALTAFIVAPISSLNPLMAAGWFAGLMEAHLRKPAVKDFDELSNELSLKLLRSNKVTKVLMVVILANLGSSIGTFLSGIGIFGSLLNH